MTTPALVDQPDCRLPAPVSTPGFADRIREPTDLREDVAVPTDFPTPALLDVSPSMEMTHDAMLERWRQGLVTPMSSTINTFVKTDGAWWTSSQDTWQRISQADRNERLDYHHDRFGSTRQAQGPATGPSPWHSKHGV